MCEECVSTWTALDGRWKRKSLIFNDLRMVFWWSWGDLNPRPQAFFEQFYMCSRLV